MAQLSPDSGEVPGTGDLLWGAMVRSDWLLRAVMEKHWWSWWRGRWPAQGWGEGSDHEDTNGRGGDILWDVL